MPSELLKRRGKHDVMLFLPVLKGNRCWWNISSWKKKRKNMSIDVILKLCFIENCSTCILASNISIKVEDYSSLSISFHNQPHQRSSQDNANLLNTICCNIWNTWGLYEKAVFSCFFLFPLMCVDMCSELLQKYVKENKTLHFLS